MASDSTLTPRPLSNVATLLFSQQVPALILLWSRHEPDRMGELVFGPEEVAEGEGGPRWILGRGDVPTAPQDRCLGLFRQAPGRLLPQGPLTCPRLSRVQLELRRLPGQRLRVINHGRLALMWRGQEVKEATLEPGDWLEILNEYLFLCVERPTVLPDPGRGDVRTHPFGRPDAFGIVGESPPMWELRRQILFAARHPGHVLILGASGTGKELVARAIHAASERGARPLVSRNAATLPEGLVDAELFGNVKNYPNPGMPERPGLVGQAHGGSLLLDEIAELPQALQAHLLRLLDQGEYQRLGESTVRHSDFRLIAATNRPPQALKHDVLARFKLIVEVPDLNQRAEDLPLLMRHLLERANAAAQGDSPLGRCTPALVLALTRHRWRTNCRELEELLTLALRDRAGSWLDLGPALGARLESNRDSAEPPPAGPAPASTAPVSTAPASPAPVSTAPVSSAPISTAPVSTAPMSFPPMGPAPSVPPVGGAPSSSPWSPRELDRLTLLRRHQFSTSACGEDPEYPGNRQRADLHLRQLMVKALSATQGDLDGAAALLAGGEDQAQRGRIRERLERFLARLRGRYSGTSTEGPELEALRGEYGPYFPALLAVLGPPYPRPPAGDP